MIDLPIHFPMSVDSQGRGPADLENTVGWECWCGNGAKCEAFVKAINLDVNWNSYGTE